MQLWKDAGARKMKAIRPVYDGIDDLDDLDEIDHVGMMACLFTQINEGINSMTDIDEEQKKTLRHMADSEMLPPGVICTEKGINDDMYIPDAPEEFGSYRGTEFDELIVMFELVRWLEECSYEWSAVVTSRYQHIARAAGIFSDRGNCTLGAYDRNDYVLNVEPKAFHELKLMLPLHWATILLDWYPVLINGIDNKKMIELGNLMIVCNGMLIRG